MEPVRHHLRERRRRADRALGVHLQQVLPDLLRRVAFDHGVQQHRRRADPLLLDRKRVRSLARGHDRQLLQDQERQHHLLRIRHRARRRRHADRDQQYPRRQEAHRQRRLHRGAELLLRGQQPLGLRQFDQHVVVVLGERDRQVRGVVRRGGVRQLLLHRAQGVGIGAGAVLHGRRRFDRALSIDHARKHRLRRTDPHRHPRPRRVHGRLPRQLRDRQLRVPPQLRLGQELHQHQVVHRLRTGGGEHHLHHHRPVAGDQGPRHRRARRLLGRFVQARHGADQPHRQRPEHDLHLRSRSGGRDDPARRFGQDHLEGRRRLREHLRLAGDRGGRTLHLGARHELRRRRRQSDRRFRLVALRDKGNGELRRQRHREERLHLLRRRGGRDKRGAKRARPRRRLLVRRVRLRLPRLGHRVRGELRERGGYGDARPRCGDLRQSRPRSGRQHAQYRRGFALLRRFFRRRRYPHREYDHRCRRLFRRGGGVRRRGLRRGVPSGDGRRAQSDLRRHEDRGALVRSIVRRERQPRPAVRGQSVRHGRDRDARRQEPRIHLLQPLHRQRQTRA